MVFFVNWFYFFIFNLSIGRTTIMNVMPKDYIIVNDISGNVVSVRVQGCHLVNKVKSLGFLYTGDLMSKVIENENEKIALIRELVKIGALFMFGYGWYPSEVMRFYKDKGLYTGTYKVISWSDQNHYRIEEE